MNIIIIISGVIIIIIIMMTIIKINAMYLMRDESYGKYVSMVISL